MSADCKHLNFTASVEISRLFNDDDEPGSHGTLLPPRSLAVDVRAWCADCRKPVRFEGPIGVGVGPGAPPMVSFDGTALHAAGHMGNNETPPIRVRLR